MFCRHNWKLLGETLIPSRMSDAVKNGFSPFKTMIIIYDNEGMFIRKLVTTSACTKCGKINQSVVRL